MGYAYLLMVEYEKAAGEFHAALRQNPDDYHANAYLGWLHIQEKRYPEAAECLMAALRRKPDNATISPRRRRNGDPLARCSPRVSDL